MGDDREYPINFVEEMVGLKQTPLADAPELFSMKAECVGCPMFNICNGCKKTIKDHKKHGVVEEHCSRMKKLAPRIIEITSEIDYVETIS